MLIYLILNNRQFNNKFIRSMNYETGNIFYKKPRISLYPIKFMNIIDDQIIFYVSKKTINSVLKTLDYFSIRDFQYSVEIVGDCSSVSLNKLRPYDCELSRRYNPRKNVNMFTMFLYETFTKSERIRQLVRVLGDDRKYDYPHLLMLQNSDNLDSIDSLQYKEYVTIISFDDKFTELEKTTCIKLFPKLTSYHDNEIEHKIPIAFNEIMKLYQRSKS